MTKVEPKIPRQIKSKMVKESILDAATKLIKTKGYEYVTVSNVCNEAQVSVGSFYHHFGNKDELLGFYLTEAFEKFSGEFAGISGDNVVEDVIHCFAIYIDFIKQQGLEFAKNYYTTSNKGIGNQMYLPHMRAKVNLPILQRAMDLLAEGQKKGLITDTISAEALGEDLCTIEKGVIFDWAICDGAYDLKAFVSRVQRNYLYAYVTKEYLKQFPDTYPERK